MDDLEQKALAARPDLKAAVAAVAVADAEFKLAYANGTSDPTLEADYNRTAPTTPSDSTSTSPSASSTATRATS